MTVVQDNILFGGEISSHPTKNSFSVADFALKQFRINADKKILIEASTGREFSGQEISEQIIKVATALHSLGIKEGDVVGLCSENRIEFAITIFATFYLNATVAPLNVTYTERELNHAVNLSRPCVIFTSPTYSDKITNVTKKNIFIKHLIVFDGKRLKSNEQSFIKFLKTAALTKDPVPMSKPSDLKDNVALIMCSSGTTGLPKGVQLTQKNIMNTLDSQFESKVLLTEATFLSVIPWFHSYGCMTLIALSCIGARFVFLPKFEEKLFLGSIQKYKVNAALVVPPLMVFLAKHPMVDNYDLSSLLMLLCGAAPLSKETEDAVKNRIGVALVRQGYGLSESTLSVVVQTDDKCKPGGVGVLRPSTYGKVIDPDTGKALGPNQRGELCFKGDCIMKGYIGDKASTDSLIDEEGWLHTGDIGFYDEDYEFFIVDRIKELIKYKAYQVPPAEIESLLLTNPKIRDAAVVGLPDEECGELPFAFVVKNPNVKLTEKEVMDFVAERTSPAKRLRGGVKFVKEIPKNASGKILRRVLRDTLIQNPRSKL